MKKVFFFLIIHRDVNATLDSADSYYSSFDGTECVTQSEYFEDISDCLKAKKGYNEKYYSCTPIVEGWIEE